MNAQPPVPDAYWSLVADELLRVVNSTASGLSPEDAERRKAVYGPNALEKGERTGAVRILLRQISSPVVLMLIAAAGVALVIHSWSDAVIILVMVFGSALLGFSQEYRAAVSMERLRAQIQPIARVLRSGVETTIASEALVPGDVAVLAAGDRIPADGVLLESRDLFVVQAALTGESMPAEKSPAPASNSAGLAQRTNCVFMGSSVRSGSGRAIIVRTGGATEFGKIARALRRREPETDFERGVRRYGVMLSQIMLLLMLAVFTANVFLDRPRIDALLFAIALGVGLSPELLPAIVTITLSQGARRLAAGGVITRRLAAVESLGGIDVLCTDKTGTLTKGEMSLETAIDAYGAASDEVLKFGFINAALQAGIRNPLDEALRATGAQRGLDAGRYKKLDEIPYDFSRRRLSVAVSDSGGAMLITKGAFANILEISTHVAGGAGANPIDDASGADLTARHEELSRQGHRVLALATKPIEGDGFVGHGDEAAMTFAGFLVFSDPIKEDIREVIEGVRALGVEVKIISGDNRFVAAHVADEIGLDGAGLLILIGFACFLAASDENRRRRDQTPVPAPRASRVPDLAYQLLEAQIRSEPGKTAAAAVVAGLILGALEALEMNETSRHRAT